MQQQHVSPDTANCKKPKSRESVQFHNQNGHGVVHIVEKTLQDQEEFVFNQLKAGISRFCGICSKDDLKGD